MKLKYRKLKRSKEEVAQAYEKEASIYDKGRITSFDGKIVQEYQINFLKKHLGLKKGMKLLEAGCGTGRILLHLARNGVKCYGIDPSKKMLKVFRQKKGSEKIILKTGDIEKIHHKDNTFDAIYTMHVLMHLPDYKKAIKEMYRVLKPGGVLIADFPNADSFWTKLSLLFFPRHKRTRIFTIKELKAFFKSYDYKISGIFSYPRTFYKIPLLRYFFPILEKVLPLPVHFRAQLFVIIKK